MDELKMKEIAYCEYRIQLVELKMFQLESNKLLFLNSASKQLYESYMNRYKFKIKKYKKILKKLNNKISCV